MPLATLSHARLAFGHRPLLDDADFELDPRERVGLIGRNGTGKSSLLGVLAGRIDLDDGELWIAPHVRVAWVAQEPVQDAASTVYDAVALGLGAEGKVLAEYHHATALLAEDGHDPRRLERVGALHARLDALDGWALGHRIDTVLSRLGLPADALIGSLSGGWKKRVALAQALAADPDVLLLDEPTNHLDLGAIAWLETLLQDFAGAVVCVTHDRRFLDAIATRITELDRGRLTQLPGKLRRVPGAEGHARQARRRSPTRSSTSSSRRKRRGSARASRRGARATKAGCSGWSSCAAIARRAATGWGSVNLQQDEGARSGKMVAELTRVSKAYGDNVLIRDFSTRILRGDRIGLIGPNGAGKTTLLKLILGEIEPDAGTVRRGANLAVAYFDQLRDQLDPEATVQDTISPGGDWVEIGGEKKHVVTYLGDFLFAPERARSPVRSLSGGERNRLLLARLFARPANVLVLDEPTNDLDIETLELLEALLQDYRGTVFLVSHDRAFLDNVVTEVIAFEGGGVLREHVGGYSDWAAYQERNPRIRKSAEAPERRRSAGLRSPARPGPRGEVCRDRIGTRRVQESPQPTHLQRGARAGRAARAHRDARSARRSHPPPVRRPRAVSRRGAGGERAARRARAAGTRPRRCVRALGGAGARQERGGQLRRLTSGRYCPFLDSAQLPAISPDISSPLDPSRRHGTALPMRRTRRRANRARSRGTVEQRTEAEAARRAGERRGGTLPPGRLRSARHAERPGDRHPALEPRHPLRRGRGAGAGFGRCRVAYRHRRNARIRMGDQRRDRAARKRSSQKAISARIAPRSMPPPSSRTPRIFSTCSDAPSPIRSWRALRGTTAARFPTTSSRRVSNGCSRWPARNRRAGTATSPSCCAVWSSTASSSAIG